MEDLITIFTSTYNRGYILGNLYDSLRKQTSYQFEWLIIDDESEDETELNINEWINVETRFVIRYYKQLHGGKHRALNKAFDLANGDFFFIVDSDDYLTPDAVESVRKWCDEIKTNETIAAVSGLKISTKGKIWGGDVKFKENTYVEAGNFEREKYNLIGDKAEVYRTELLAKHKFPEFEGEYFVTEEVCWMKIAAEGYKIRWYNKPIYICEYLDDGLTKTGANDFEGHKNNYQGYCYYISEALKLKPFINKMQHLREYDKTVSRLGKSLPEKAKDINLTFLQYIAGICIGIPIGYLYKKLKY